MPRMRFTATKGSTMSAITVATVREHFAGLTLSDLDIADGIRDGRHVEGDFDAKLENILACAQEAAEDHDLRIAEMTATYREQPADVISDGREWYGRVGNIAGELGEKYGTSKRVAAFVIAALSSNNKWARNIVDAETVLSGGPGSLCTYGRCQTLAREIARTGDCSLLKGPKVTAFAANIAGDLDYVTLDRWACKAYDGNPLPGSASRRARIIDAYRRVAATVGDSPAELQAVLWTAVRGSAH